MVSIYNSGRNRYWGPDGNPFAKESKKSIKQEQTFLDNSHRVASIAAARSLAPMLLTDTSEATSSSAYIAELARALRYDVDLIYEWVYSNVDFYPVWGAYKGALGTLIDKTATPFDQCALMVALLRESRHTANFVKGNIHLTRSQVENWLGTTESTSSSPSASVLTDANIPNLTFNYDETGLLDWVEMDHVWVQVEIDGFDYVFDPSFKTYDYTSGVNLATAMGWVDTDSESYDELRDAALVGATYGETYGDLTNLNRSNIMDSFSDYGNALLTWIRNHQFASSLDQIIGGREIQPLSETPLRQTALSYQTSGSGETIWTEIPDESRATYQIRLTDDSPTDPTVFLDHTFFADEVFARRLTIAINGDDQALLRLEGELIAISSTLEPDANNFVTGRFLITHPFESTSADIPWTQGVYVNDGALYFMGLAFGPSSQGMADYFRERQLQNQFDGGTADDENVLGESLAVYYYMQAAQSDACTNILCAKQLGNTITLKLHAGGIAEYNEYFNSPALDLGGHLAAYVSAIGDGAAAGNVFAASTIMSGALEGGVMQQNLVGEGISAVRMLDAAIADGQTVYPPNLLTWDSIQGLLTNWSADAIGSMDQTINANEGVVIVHDNGHTTVGTFVGGGFLNFSAFSGISDTLIGSNTSGGGISPDQSKGETANGSRRAPSRTTNNNSNVAITPDPINLFTGSALYDKADLTVGSSSYPYALTFSRSYASNQRLVSGPLGLGWTHNLATSVAPGSNGLRATGEVSAKEAAGTIASAFIWLKLSMGIGYPTFVDNLNVLISVVSMRWLIDELFTNNSISINDVSVSRTFVKLIDGTYNPQPGSADTIVINMDGTYTFKNPQQQTWNFNTDGTIHTYVDPAGVTVTWSYSSGKLHTVSNGLW